MTSRETAHGPYPAELVAILAAGYLRLTETGKNSAVSRPKTEHKELDVSTVESPHCDDENADGGFSEQ